MRGLLGRQTGGQLAGPAVRRLLVCLPVQLSMDCAGRAEPYVLRDSTV